MQNKRDIILIGILEEKYIPIGIIEVSFLLNQSVVWPSCS